MNTNQFKFYKWTLYLILDKEGLSIKVIKK